MPLSFLIFCYLEGLGHAILENCLSLVNIKLENVNARFSDKSRPQNNDDDFQQYTINFQQLLKLEKGRTNIFSFSLPVSRSLLI